MIGQYRMILKKRRLLQYVMGRIADYLRRMDRPVLFVCVAKTRLQQSNVYRSRIPTVEQATD